MHVRNTIVRFLAGILAGAISMAAAPGAATAAHEPGPDLECDGEHYVLRPDAGNWGASKLEGTRRKFIPVRYSITAQTSAGDVHGPFLSEKGNGHAHPNQETVDCTFTSFHEDVTDPVSGEIVDVTFTVVVTAVAKG